jgi:hypothetical protein
MYFNLLHSQCMCLLSPHFLEDASDNTIYRFISPIDHINSSNSYSKHTCGGGRDGGIIWSVNRRESIIGSFRFNLTSDTVIHS